ncbi:hypothetical protein KY311_04040 [Candidatus Woesearchaeota archaeon]|nr:hypothetical protein [Candidatus Woesearchaeota archaeon]
MSTKISIYLAGNVAKVTGNEDDSWRDNFKEKLGERLGDINTIFLDPTQRPETVTDSYSIFCQDIFFCANCDFVVVEAMSKVGVGVGVEMLTAKMHGVPVVSIVPKNSYYRSTDKYSAKVLKDEMRENWLHPFMESLSDAVVEDLDSAANWIKEHLSEKKEIKDHSIINQAIDYYRKNHYDKDDQAKDAFG